MIPFLPYKAVIFDMDGLLFDTERIGFEAFCHAVKKYGYSDCEDFFRQLIGTTVVEADQAMEKKFGSDFPIDAVRKERDFFTSKIRQTSGIPVKAGVFELLNYLHERNIPLAVASSSVKQVVQENLQYAGIEHYFKLYLCGDEITYSKPHPEMYLTVAQKLSIHPQNCIVLEDSVKGITAAHAAGMIPIMIPDMQIPTDVIKHMAYLIFPSLHEFQLYLQEQDVLLH